MGKAPDRLPTISIVMPVLNEEANVRAAVTSALAAFDQRGIEGEVIVVNDGSSDRSGELVRELIRNEPRIRMIEHKKPQGIGASFWDGVGSAGKEAVMMLPGDNENDPEEALFYLDLLNKVDIVVPFIYNSDVRERLRRVISSLYRLIMNVSFGTNLNYTNGAVIYRRSILNGLALKSTGFIYQAEILVKLIRKGYLYAEVPSYLAARSSGRSKALTFRSLFNVIGGYLRLMWDIHIVRVAGEVGKTLAGDSITFSRNKESNK